MNYRFKWGFIGLCSVLLFFFVYPYSVASANEPPRILFVYDSLNIAEKKENDVDAIQRLLTSSGAIVQTVETDKYIGGMLSNTDYDGVITLINWPQKELSEHFVKDRQAFSGKKLHIGPKLTADEQSLFSGKWRELSHRQFTLKDEQHFYSQTLGYQDEITVLEGSAGLSIGLLETQEIDYEEIPFGVLEKNNGFLPFFSQKGAVFLKSAELVNQWLGEHQSFSPILTIDGLNPMKDMSIASKFQQLLAKTNIPYIISTTSTNQNNTTAPFDIFTDILRSFESGTGIIFLEVPVVNNVNLNDNHALSQMLEQQISLFIEESIFPVGLSAYGYWNQDAQYQADGLELSKTVILRENPAIEKQYYRSRTKKSTIFKTAFFNIPFDYLEGVTWQRNGNTSDYEFPMPVTMSFSFPDSDKEIATVLKKIDQSPLFFYQIGKSHFEFDLQTQTQHIELLNSRRYLNGKLVNSLNNVTNKVIPETTFKGQFARLFNITNVVLIVVVVATMSVLAVLFFFGRRNYRSKYIQKKGDHK
ncbi:hypothetical protein UAY_01949 [Enterococcus moraviensis ATCC BAA-383]|uniref:DUF2334 domain-containing protein n=1 Tax=Enterococcus moraviensis ATCC BAA-383 TaxID=1158609 RepID=R2QRL5_9ENTE|nr:hypothetical protein [Enterococcus moraviensis]EOH99172.1 hypothetical protein UAY_01949 [Enterococcus moraviensis ATCC BAA-383]EOT72145.1 hypothetical protein I586_01953 [Enterococcus moraviensis ATCC BAA-383]